MTGAFGGFGLATANWLVENGRASSGPVGRRGAATPRRAATVDELSARGVELSPIPATSPTPTRCQRLFEKSARHRRRSPASCMPRWCSTMRSSPISMRSGSAASWRRKSRRRHLDRLTRDAALDYFVIFSSVTTLIGNPGQGNYVAANGFWKVWRAAVAPKPSGAGGRLGPDQRCRRGRPQRRNSKAIWRS